MNGNDRTHHTGEPDPAAADRRRVRYESTAIAVTASLAAIVGVLGLWFAASATIREDYRHYLKTLAQTAALQVDPELHQRLRDPAQRNNPDYRRVVAPLRRMREALPDVRFIYTMVRDGEQFHLVLDAADPGDRDGDGVEDQAGLWEIYTEIDPVLLAAFGNDHVKGQVTATDSPLSDKWGTFMTGWAPLLDSAGRQYGALGMDIDASVYVAHIAQARRWAMIGCLPAALLILLMTFGFHRLRSRSLAAARLGLSARKAIETALVQSESNFRSLFELSPVGICLTELSNGRFLKVNDALVASTGYTREELLQQTFWDITPSSWHEFERGQLRVLEHGTHFGTYEKEYLRKDGSSYPVLISGTRVTDAAGRDVAWAIVQDISERKAMESRLADAARRDRLTGLANRTLFLERLQAAVERVRNGQQSCFAVLFLDFDRFKLVNDTMGHEAGDSLLREIAARLQISMRASDTDFAGLRSNLIARFGGDEFLVLVNDLENCAAAEPIADRLLAALARTYSIGGRDVHTTASIGIVTSDQCLDSADALVRNADVAMYEAKRSGRACAVRFDDTMQARLTRYVTIDSGLRRALGTPELSLVYQPIVELATGRVTSVEALARWQHPQLGQVAPSEFIPVAEESDLIVTLGQWVLQEACATLADWRARDPRHAPQSISVNISRAELALGERLLVRVRETLLQTGLPAQCLRLEVTERDAMRDPPATLRLMHALRKLGVNLAMDDFGTGTSSLACLRDYPFDVIKIDRSFVSDVNSSTDVLAVIHAAVTLVGNLGMTSVAEGVETSEHVAVLQALGCHHAQGHYFSNPLTKWQMRDYMWRSNAALQSSSSASIDVAATVT